MSTFQGDSQPNREWLRHSGVGARQSVANSPTQS